MAQFAVCNDEVGAFKEDVNYHQIKASMNKAIKFI